MFDAVRNNKRMVQVFLALIILPFAFFGVESYVSNVGTGNELAKIGDVKISPQQFQEALREQQDRLRAQLGGQFDSKLLDTPEARKAILDDLVDQRLLVLEANKRKLVAGDEAIRRTVGSIDAFKVDGKFSSERYEAALRNQGMTPAGFEAQLRQDLTVQQLAGALGQSGLVARTVSDRVIAMQTETRNVQESRIALDGYLGQVKLADGAAKKFYDENAKQFETPEQAKAEYLVLSMETIGAQMAVSDAEIKSWYDGHKDRYAVPEERRASHILIASEKVGKDKAKSRAEELLAEIRKNPSSFAELAKKNSDDPGSAAKGGDLGFFGRGMMVKPFEDTTFALKDGEISGVVESDFGFHIIKLTGIHAAKEKPLAEVRGEIEEELRKTAASRKFAEAAETFSNLVYEQSDSLKPAAERFKLEVKQSAWINRQTNPANGPVGNEKVLAALFSEDSVKNKRNTETVEIAPNTLVAARIAEYKPAALLPFESVKTSIETLLTRQEAQAMARKEGEARLEALKKGEDKLAWGAIKKVSRMDPRQVPPPAVPVVFKMDAAKLPAYAGVELPGSGYLLVKLAAVDAGLALDAARKQALVGQLATLEAQEEVKVYLAALRARYKVEINKAALEAR
jgi:peptidyl-prolyl cis-trans isomerase D